MANKLLTRLSRGPLLCAEGYLFELERRGYISVGPYVPEVVLDEPTAVKQLHREFVRAGSDVIEAFTYYGHREKLKVIGKEHILEDLNRRALEIAFEVRDEMKDLVDFELYVAGNISNSGCYVPGDAETEDYVFSIMEEQCEWAKEANVDYMIGETFDHVGEALLATKACAKYGMPSVITFITHRNDLTREDIHLADACQMIKDAGADVVGLNCARGPASMLPLLEQIRNKVDGYIAALPVGYSTTKEKPTMQSLTDDHSKHFLDIDGHTCTRFEMADFARQCLDMDITYLGVCCGGAPHHVRAIAETMGRTPISSKYSPDMSKHIWFGSYDNDRLKAWNLNYRDEM